MCERVAAGPYFKFYSVYDPLFDEIPANITVITP